jgi:D-alanyl-D-alanine carboxypeptidase/D-alanyl-D-alanine-endopeptidase (penicillin-binding protein 4)
MGPRVAVAVSGLDGRAAYAVGPRTVIPASTLKLLTAIAALAAVGPEHRFETRTVRSGRVLTLVGGGDPLLARTPPQRGTYPQQADLATLARETARRLRADDRTRVSLGYDDTLFRGAAVNPAWKPSYVAEDVVSPISALWVDEGREDAGLSPRSADPAAAAARAFAAALRARGVRVTEVRRQRAPAAAEPVAAVSGAELVEVVQHVLEVSDNEGAEVLARHVALADGRPASFGGTSRALLSVVGDLGVPLGGAVVRDGSGLARGNRLDARTLLAVLAVAAEGGRPELAGVLEGLPVAGFNGSLASRFTVRADAALGFVRAKTGTLTGVHGLAGVTVAGDGTPVLFVAVADRVPVRHTLAARARLDRIAAALTACRCGG